MKGNRAGDRMNGEGWGEGWERARPGGRGVCRPSRPSRAEPPRRGCSGYAEPRVRSRPLGVTRSKYASACAVSVGTPTPSCALQPTGAAGWLAVRIAAGSEPTRPTGGTARRSTRGSLGRARSRNPRAAWRGHVQRALAGFPVLGRRWRALTGSAAPARNGAHAADAVRALRLAAKAGSQRVPGRTGGRRLPAGTARCRPPARPSALAAARRATPGALPIGPRRTAPRGRGRDAQCGAHHFAASASLNGSSGLSGAESRAGGCHAAASHLHGGLNIKVVLLGTP
jgi:hypothetical protein